MPDLTSMLSVFLTQLYNGTWVGGTIDFTNNAQTGTLADARLSANVPLLNVVNTFSAGGTHLWGGAATGQTRLKVQSTAAGTTNNAALFANADVANANLTVYSSLFTPVLTYQLASGALLSVFGVGGLSIAATTALSDIRYYTNSGTMGERGRMFSTGGFSWGDTTDPGQTNFRVAGTATLVGGIVGGASKAAGAVTSMTVVNGVVTACT